MNKWIVAGIVIMNMGVVCTAIPLPPEGLPDLTRVDPPEKLPGKDWFLHCGKTRGWAYRNKMGKCDDARQILVTRVPADSSARNDLQVGDVILGVNGEYFSSHPIFAFRKASFPVRDAEGQLDVILWRKGWEEPRHVKVNQKFLPIDFTQGGKPGPASDWNLGATGARGWMQGKDRESFHARQILITGVEAESPADGILQQGDVILGVDGDKFSWDARRAFAAALTQAETEEAGGKLRVLRWRDGTEEDVVIRIPVMGSYSKTTPRDCEKSEQILEAAVAYLVKKDILNGKGRRAPERAFAALALMSTGEQEHMKMATGFVLGIRDTVLENPEQPPAWGYHAWGWGYNTVLLGEYYLLTGDESVLPAIRILAESIAAGQSGVGSWGHRMAQPVHGRCYGYGAMNQAGNICFMALNFAERCGITSPEIKRAVVRGHTYLSMFVDSQTVPYGDNIALDGSNHDDNGKTSSAAVGFSILGDQAGTDFLARMTVASWSVREQGHTGNIWSMLWGPLGAQRAGGAACSAFLHEMTWLFDLERRWDGGFSYQGKMGFGYWVDEKTGRKSGSAEHQYIDWDTTGSRILMYTLPQQRLVIQGKDTLVARIPDSEITDAVNAGRPKTPREKFAGDRFDDYPNGELLALLGSWSPVVRSHAATSLAKKPGDPTSALLEMLEGGARYDIYGACTALRQGKPLSADAVQPLITLLGSQDRMTKAYAMLALGASTDERARQALFGMAARSFPEDTNGYLHRILAISLFGPDGMLSASLDGMDRTQLLAVTGQLLNCTGGAERTMVANAVMDKLSLEDIASLWPAILPAIRECAPTGVGGASGVRMKIAETLSKRKIKEGMPLLIDYMKLQKMHGGGSARHQQIMGLLTDYGVAAQEMLPALEEYLIFLEQDHPPIGKFGKSKSNFYEGQIPFVKEAIETIKTSREESGVVSIKPSRVEP